MGINDNCCSMRVMKQPYFIVFCGVFLVIYTLQRLQVPLPFWVNNYVNDLLCMPVVLTICLAAVRFFRKDQTLLLPLSAILSLTLFYAIYFEYYLPTYHPRYTADVLDVVLYFLGAALFFVFQKVGLIPCKNS